MKKTFIIAALILFALSACLSTPIVWADDWYDDTKPGYYTLVDESGKELTMMAREVFVRDEYISTDNARYIIMRIDKNKQRAYARFEGYVDLPLLEEVDEQTDNIAIAQEERQGNVVIYATHTSESFVPTDGKQSILGDGGILDVGTAFQSAMEKRGISAVFDKTSHDPHDAGAYRRSRATATRLIKENMPVAAKFDIHRDGVPTHLYDTKVEGNRMVKVRMVVGRGNQNFNVNKDLAYKIKAVADRAYPGLIKDIFIGRGSFNQDLSPRSLLLEFGTYGSDKGLAKKSADYMAEVVEKAMYGGIIPGKTQEGKATRLYRSKPINQDRTVGIRDSFMWMIGIGIAAILLFLAVAGGRKEMMAKASDFFNKEFRDVLKRKKE